VERPCLVGGSRGQASGSDELQKKGAGSRRTLNCVTARWWNGCGAPRRAPFETVDYRRDPSPEFVVNASRRSIRPYPISGLSEKLSRKM
jgi:hypothetical protein